MTVDSYDRRPISRFVYGFNFPERQDLWGRSPLGFATLSRFGGNRTSAYNWETNASNCGNDCGIPSQRRFPSGQGTREAVARKRPVGARSRCGVIVSVPMLGWVAGQGRPGLPEDAAGAAAFRTLQGVSPRKEPAFGRAGPEGCGRLPDEFVAWVSERSPSRGCSTARPLLPGQRAGPLGIDPRGGSRRPTGQGPTC